MENNEIQYDTSSVQGQSEENNIQFSRAIKLQPYFLYKNCPPHKITSGW